MSKILVVDDEPSIRELYRREFEDEGHEVRTAADASSALHMLLDWPPDLLLLDIRLGTESGLDLLRCIILRYPRLRTVIVTAYCGYRDDFISWLADAYVTKSSDLTELKQVVARLLAESEVHSVTGGNI